MRWLPDRRCAALTVPKSQSASCNIDSWSRSQHSMSSTRPTVAISAPGKVLFAGGYLVLDREYTGLVFGLSARINVIATEIHTGPGVQLTEIVVESPQFQDAQWRYGYHLAPEGGGIAVTQLQM